MGPWMNAASIQSRARRCARGQLQLGPVVRASDSFSSPRGGAPVRQLGPGGTRVGQLQLGTVAGVGQLQLGPRSALVDSSSSGPRRPRSTAPVRPEVPASDSSSSARWCPLPTAPARPVGARVDSSSPARGARVGQLQFGPVGAHVGQLQLGPVGARRTAPARPRWRARRTAPAWPRGAHLGQLSSARRRMPGAAIVAGSQRGPMEARASDSASSGLLQPGVTRPPISGKRS